jgi:hypothetical protein
MKRFFLLVMFAFLVPVSLAFAYNVTITAPNQSGGATPTSCRFYMGGNLLSVAGTSPAGVGTTPAVDKSCGVAITYTGLVTALGTYMFQYTRVDAAGESAKSPTTTVIIGQKPDDPGAPPTVTIECTPAPCPTNIVITVTP